MRRRCRGLPFAVQVPNPTTVSAMKELDDGKGQRFDSAEELFRDLGLRHAEAASSQQSPATLARQTRTPGGPAV